MVRSDAANGLDNQRLGALAPLVEWLVVFLAADEKFLGLIEWLAAEVKKNNPDAEILKDKAMVDAFETYTLNEMEKQEKSASTFRPAG